jgi:hypothetical protein
VSAQPAGHLHLVDNETGEISPEAPAYPEALALLGQLETQIKMLDRRHKGDLLRIAQLEQDREQAALASPLRKHVEVIYALWKAACGKRRPLHFTDRESIAAAVKHLGFDTCVRAVAGARYEPYTRRQRNGKVKRFDDLNTIFKTYGKVSDFAGRAPRDYSPSAEKIAAIAGVDVEWVERELAQPARRAGK